VTFCPVLDGLTHACVGDVNERHATPHAWAVDAWTALMARGGNLVAIGPHLAALAAFAAILMVLATVQLRRVLS
jgi:ABC-2 type transport system permease protein